MTLKDSLFFIENSAVEADSFTYSIRLNPECFIYKAHFPENPITPGVCVLQIATELLQEHLQRELELTEVNNVKYLSILSPTETTEVDYIFNSLVDTAEGFKIKISVKNSSTTFAKISLTYKAQ